MSWEYHPGYQMRFSQGTVTASQTVDLEIPSNSHIRIVSLAAKAFAAIAAGSVVDVRLLVNGVLDTNFTMTINNATGTAVQRKVATSAILLPGDYATLRFIETGGTTASVATIAVCVMADFRKN